MLHNLLTFDVKLNNFKNAKNVKIKVEVRIAEFMLYVVRIFYVSLFPNLKAFFLKALENEIFHECKWWKNV